MSINITPNDILQKKFSQAFRGLDADEVYDFIRLTASALEEMLRENMLQSEKLRQMEEMVSEYRHMENTLKNTLISSQKIGQEIKEEAQRKSTILIRESELESERIIQKAKQRKELLEEEAFQLLNQHRRFRAEVVAMVESHRKMVEAQDSRLLLDYGFGNPEALRPAVEPVIEPIEGQKPETDQGD